MERIEKSVKLVDVACQVIFSPSVKFSIIDAISNNVLELLPFCVGVPGS